MDLLSLFYFVELSKDLHITRTANRLYISQQSLSNHIQRLEKHYGVPLLRRKPTLQLTLAGEQVLQFAKRLEQENANLRDVLSDIKTKNRGLLRFGTSTTRMNVCLPVISDFLSRYPHVELRLNNRFSQDLEKMLLNNELDLAFIFGFAGHPKLEELYRVDEKIYLCVSDPLLKQIYGETAEELKQKAVHGAHLEWFSELPFCVLENRMGEQLQHCFEEARFQPRIFMTSTYTQACNQVCYQHLAASFMPQMSLFHEKDSIPPDINIFPLVYRGEHMTQNVSLICTHERYLPQYTKIFLQNLIEFLNSIENTSLEHIV